MAAISKFDDKTCGAILGALRAGTSYEIAAQAAGVSRMTMWRWVRLGQKDLDAGVDTNHARFLREIEQAEAFTIAGIEQSLMRTAASGVDWRAAAWVLARKRPLDYGDAPLTNALRDGMATELMDMIKSRAPLEFYEQLLEYLLLGFKDEPEPVPMPAELGEP